MGPQPSLSYSTLVKARVENLRRLTKALGLGTSGWIERPDEKHCLARAIVFWYKRNPQQRRKRIDRERCLHRT